MMAEQKTTKVKKKTWYTIVAPKYFNELVLGETPVYDPQEMIGKVVTVNLMVLTNDMKKQNINVEFKVDKLEGNRGNTSIMGYALIPSSVKRMVRRNRDKIDTSFVCKTSDGVLIRIKPLLITKANAKGSVLSKLLNHCTEYGTRLVAKLSAEKFVEDLINHNFQDALYGELKKIYPLKTCEIRMMKIVPAGKKVRVEKVVEESPPEQPPEEVTEEVGVSA